jgi:hypothetical protein
LRKQLIRNRIALRRQRSFQRRIEIVLQSKVNRRSEKEERPGKQAGVPGSLPALELEKINYR